MRPTLLLPCLLSLILAFPAERLSADESVEQKIATLQQQANEAAQRKATAEATLKTAREKMQSLSDMLLKQKAELSKTEAARKAAEANLPKQQEAAKKAEEAKQQAEQVSQQAAKEAEEAKGKDGEQAAAEKAKQAAEKLAAAVKAQEEAQAAAKKTEESLVAAKKSMAELPEAIKKTEADIAAFKPELEKAEAEFAAINKEAIQKQTALEEAQVAAGQLVSFAKQVAPIFAQRCLACHNARTAKGRLNLESFASLMKGGESGEEVTPGKGDASTLYIMIEDGSMPQDADPLTPEQLALVKKWIDTGARLDAGVDPKAPLITVMPKPVQPAPPDSYRVPVPVTALAFSPDGSQLASSGYHEVILWNPTDGQIIRRISNLAERAYDLEFSADGKMLAVAAGTPGQMGEVKLFNAEDGTLLADLATIEDAMFAVAFSPDGTQLAAAGADRGIRVFNLASREQTLLIEDHADWVMDIAWSPDGKKLASASRDKTSKVFDLTTKESLVTFNSHGQPVFGVAFSPDGKQIATSGQDKRIRLWNVSDAKQAREITGFGNEVFRIQITPEGHIYSVSADKIARVHQLSDGKQVRTFNGHTDWIYCLSYNAATKKLATGSYDGEIRLWNAEDGKELLKFIAAPGQKAAETAAK